MVTANNRILEGDEPFISAEWINGYRAQRIREELDALERVTVEDCCRIQCDQRSLPGLRLQAIAARCQGATPLEREALRLLAGWDGELTAGSAGGAVYGVLLQELTREAHADLEDDLAFLLGRGILDLFSDLAYLGRRRARAARPAGGARRRLAPGRRHVGRAPRPRPSGRPRARWSGFGGDPAAWRWGDLHTLVLDHPLAELPPLRHLFRADRSRWAATPTRSGRPGSRPGAAGAGRSAARRCACGRDLGDPARSCSPLTGPANRAVSRSPLTGQLTARC